MFKKVLIVFLVSLTVACGGGGGGDSSAPAEPIVTERIAGIWQGIGDDVGDVGLITENGDLFFISIPDNTLTTGRVTSASGSKTLGTLSSYTAFGFVFPDGNTVATGTFDADVKTRTTLSGTTSSKFGTGTFSFEYDNDYDLPSSLAITTGTWQGVDFSGAVVTLTFNNAGVITGTDTDGCLYAGNITIIDSDFNAYNMVLTLSNCGQFDGTFSGVATMDSDVTTNDTLIYGVSTPLIVLVQALTKQ